MRKIFLLMDGRAKSDEEEDTHHALVMDTAQSEREARERGQRLWSGWDAIWAEHEMDDHNVADFKGLRWDLPPAADF